MFYQKMLEFAHDYPGITPQAGSSEMDVVWELLKDGRYVFMTMHTNYLLWRKKHCGLTVVKEIVAQDMQTFYLQKNSPYLEAFNKM